MVLTNRINLNLNQQTKPIAYKQKFFISSNTGCVTNFVSLLMLPLLTKHITDHCLHFHCLKAMIFLFSTSHQSKPWTTHALSTKLNSNSGTTLPCIAVYNIIIIIN